MYEIWAQGTELDEQEAEGIQSDFLHSKIFEKVWGRSYKASGIRGIKPGSKGAQTTHKEYTQDALR